jgi:hypothetical protein
MFRKRNRWQKTQNRRRPGRNLHHLLPRARGGKDNDKNLLLIDIEKHEAWHRIFGLRSLGEVIALLQRLDRMKRHQPLRKAA